MRSTDKLLASFTSARPSHLLQANHTIVNVLDHDSSKLHYIPRTIRNQFKNSIDLILYIYSLSKKEEIFHSQNRSNGVPFSIIILTKSFQVNNQSNHRFPYIQMSKKVPTPKSVKTLDKNQQNGRDRNQYSYKQLPHLYDTTKIAHLEICLQEEIKARHQGHQELLEMINHLNQTKKSKIPVKFQKLTVKKFFSPNKISFQTKQNQQAEIKSSVILSLQSKRQLPVVQNKIKIAELEEEVKTMKLSILKLDKLLEKQEKQDKLEKTKEEFRLEMIELKQKISNLCADISVKVQQSCKDALMKQINSNQLMMEKIILNFQSSLNTVEDCVKSMIGSLQNTQCNIFNNFQRIEREVKCTSQSVLQTKQTIQQTLFGQVKSKQRGDGSIVSIDLPAHDYSRGELSKKSVIYENDRLRVVNSRVESLERRVDFLYEEYFKLPVISEIVR